MIRVYRNNEGYLLFGTLAPCFVFKFIVHFFSSPILYPNLLDDLKQVSKLAPYTCSIVVLKYLTESTFRDLINTVKPVKMNPE